MIKLIAGPMATLSTEAFRRLVEKFGGCDEYYTEMINAGSLLTRGPFEKYYLLNDIAGDKIVWQLTGKDAKSMAEAATEVSALGGIGVDLNMGCSAPEIVRSGAGIAWMIKPIEEAKELVSLVKKAIPEKMRLSVKLRLGDEDFSDEKFFTFCQMLVDQGVTRLVLHPRTKKEKLSRPIRWQYVERLALLFEKNNVSVVLNGNVSSATSAARALVLCPHIDGIMIARAAAQKPWIFQEIKAALKLASGNYESLSAGNDLESERTVGKKAFQSDEGKDFVPINLQNLALDFLDYLELYQPEEFWKTRMQRFFSYYCQNFSFAHYATTLMLNATSIDNARHCIKEYIEKVPDDEYIYCRL